MSQESRPTSPSSDGTAGPSRRTFLQQTGTAALGLALAGGRPVTAQQASAGNEPLRKTPFAEVHELGSDVWSIQSTPMQGRFDTTCNGGIIAGSERVLVIEAFNTVEGAAWVSDLCRELTGRHPTDVLVTHYHADHVNGAVGYQRGSMGPRILSTATTRDLIVERSLPTRPEGEDSGTEQSQPRVLPPDVVLRPEGAPTDSSISLDLGNREVEVFLRSGHTPSDVVVKVPEPAVAFCGDLVFYGLFPNYMDAIPTALRKSCRELFVEKDVHYVPGHGPAVTAEDLTDYFDLLDHVEGAARAAFEAGTPAAEAAAAFEVPSSLGTWFEFRPDIHQSAFEAWYRELEG